jgi:hypothetical protein
MRNQELVTSRLKVDEQQRKLQDLAELKRHIQASLGRLESAPAAGPGGSADSGEDAEARLRTLQRSLDESEAKVKETETKLAASRQELDEQENVRESFDRVPVAVGSRRGRGQVEHVRIIRTQQRD